MNNNLNPDLITLVGDDGNQIEFEILDIIYDEDEKFYVLIPYYSNPADAVNDPGEYYIFKADEIDGEEELTEIDDETKLDRISGIFEERYDDEFFEQDE